jgi:hypothetical protein
MSEQSLTVAPGPAERVVRAQTGQLLQVPSGWHLLPPGDAALTRRVKLAGPSWTVTERKGRKVFSRGVWAPAATIERCRRELSQERADPRYARKLEAGRQRRARAEEEYGEEFLAAVVAFLDFAPPYSALASQVALAIMRHATPVGSGTVARTQRIPIEERAAAATFAWLRHQTTNYDSMRIPRVKGMRRDVRRELAQRSRALLQRYRAGVTVGPEVCPLTRALKQ